MFGKPEMMPQAPERPSTAFEDVSQRTTQYPGPEQDYAVQMPGDDPQEPEEYGFSDDIESPVSVYVVGAAPGDRTYRDWSSGTFSVEARAVQVASYDRRRLRLRVRNLDAAKSVIVVRNETDLNHTGYEIPFGETEEFLHNGGVFVRSEDGTAVSISVYIEFEIDEFFDDDKSK